MITSDSTYEENDMSRTRTVELKRVAEELGMRVDPNCDNAKLQAQVEAQLKGIFASRGIKVGATVRYAPNAPATVRDKQLKVECLDIDWDKGCPRVSLGKKDHFYTALTLIKYGSVVK